MPIADDYKYLLIDGIWVSVKEGAKTKKRPIVFFTIFFKAFGGFGVLELVNFNEQTKRLLCIFSGFLHPDIMDILFCFGRTILVI